MLSSLLNVSASDKGCDETERTLVLAASKAPLSTRVTLKILSFPDTQSFMSYLFI